MGQRPGCRAVDCSPEPVHTYLVLWPGVEIPSAEQCGSVQHLWGQLGIFKSVPRGVSLKEPQLSCCIGLGPSRVPSLPEDKGLENSGLP